MAGELILPEVASSGVPTPAATKDGIHCTNDTPTRLARKDSSGNILYVQEQYILGLTADFTLANQTALQKAFGTPTNGAVTLPTSTSWVFKAMYQIANTGTTSHAWGVGFLGTATFTSLVTYIQGNNNAASAPAAGGLTGISTVATAVTATPALATADTATIILHGILRINAGGTVIPAISETGPSGVAPTMKANSFFWLSPWGSNTVASLGPWT